LSYEKDPRNASGRLLIVDFTNNKNYDDTLIFSVGDNLEFALRKRPLRTPVNFFGEFSSGHCRLLAYQGVRATSESRSYLDAETGKQKTLFKDMPERFLNPDAEKLTLRATQGIRHLLQFQTGFAQPDLAIRPTGLALNSEYKRLDFPVLGELAVKTEGGQTLVTLDLYLYPLSAAQ
jgi:hypothetical protein